jgi:hypothetical protein
MRSRQLPASNFLAAQNFAFTASLCHAKITPAALHRGDPVTAAAKARKAAGPKPKFQLGDPQGLIARQAVPAAQTPSMTPS